MTALHPAILLISIFGTSFLLALSGALMPGPVLTVTISESSSRGFWAGPLIIVGHGILELCLVIMLWSGILMSLANPYWTIWWATVGLGYLGYSMKCGPAGVLAFFAGHITADFAWYSGISFTVSKGRGFIKD